MKFGYARVSTREQNLDLQIQSLEAEGCGRIYQDIVSGSKTERPELDRMLDSLRKGDLVIVWKLDRLGRSLKHLIELINGFNEKGIGLKSLNDPIDTSTSQGRFVFNIFASLAEFERELIRERTMAGLQAARARGRIGGKKKGLSQEAQNKALAAEALYKDGNLTVKEISKRLSISKPTLYNYLRHQGVRISSYNIRLTVSNSLSG